MQKDQDYRKAYFISWLVNTQTQTPVSASQIADPLYLSADEIKEQTMEHKKKDHDILWQEFGLNKKGVDAQ